MKSRQAPLPSIHGFDVRSKMKKIIVLNIVWVLLGLAWWIILDLLYVKNEALQSLADFLVVLLFIWPLILIYPLVKEMNKEKNRNLRDRWISLVVFAGSLLFQYLGTFGLIVTVGIGFHFSIGGNL